MTAPTASTVPRPGLRRRLWNKWRRITIERYGRREFTLPGGQAFVSFTFDDFPRTALVEGGRILAEHGARGTYFVSCQLLDGLSESGRIASRDDLEVLLRDGHELGCHTFEHLDGCRSTVAAFERSIAANRNALRESLPDADLAVFAYPLDGPVLSIKLAVGQHFVGCRGGGQAFNSGMVDLNLLKAYFFDWKTRDALQEIERLIERNAAAGGWLIFATHDVTPEPSRYGCTPGVLRTSRSARTHLRGAGAADDGRVAAPRARCWTR